jgi:hypothetical protein
MNINHAVKPKKNISFLVSVPLHQTIDAFCKKHAVSKSLLIRTSVAQMIEQYESAAK